MMSFYLLVLIVLFVMITAIVGVNKKKANE